MYTDMAWYAAVVAAATGMVTLLVVGVLAFVVLKKPTDTAELAKERARVQAEEMEEEGAKVHSPLELSDMIRKGAISFLVTEYIGLAIFVFVLFWVVCAITDSWWPGFCFLVGAFLSGATGWIGMGIATMANVRTCVACSDEKNGLSMGLRVAFNAGAVMGLSVVSTGLLGVTFCYIWGDGDLEAMAGLGMGASCIALFARVGGGIYTKAADVGADLVGKVVNDLPEDDIRNAGVIADNVGDNVGDVAGMGADLFESYVGSIIAASTLGRDVFDFDHMGQPTASTTDLGVTICLYLAAAGMLCSIIGVALVRTKANASLESLLWSIRFAISAAGILIVALAAVGAEVIPYPWEYFGCIIIGLVTGIAFGYATEYTTAYTYEPVRSIARSGASGAAPVIIQGLGVGMLSTMPPVILITICIFACYELGNAANPENELGTKGGGAFGVALASVGMLSTLGVTLATDAYGPIADNAGGIAEMSHCKEEVRTNTDRLDSLGNTTAATGKGFAIGSGVLTAIALMIAFTSAVGLEKIDIIADAERFLPGFLIGSMAPYVFAALTMLSVRKSAMAIMATVAIELKDPAVMNFTKEADYQKCVSIATKASLQEMVLPGFLAICIPFIIGMGLGPKALAGCLIGSIGSGFLLAVTMANAGGAWDNAKKWVKAEKCDGGSKNDIALLIGKDGKARKEVHEAVVSGDTVGDPFKDTSGPALNILFKLMSMVSLVMAPAFKQSVHDEYWWVALIILGVAIIFSAIWWVYLDKSNAAAAAVEREAVINADKDADAPVGEESEDASSEAATSEEASGSESS